MTPRNCIFHSGIATEISNTQRDVSELKKTISEDVLDKIEEAKKELHKKPSTGTLISVVLIFIGIISTVLGLAFAAYQKRIERLEETDIRIQKSMDDQYRDINTKLEAITKKMGIAKKIKSAEEEEGK